MHVLNEYDLKQVRLIEKKINAFENDKLYFIDLISDLSGLLNALESVFDSWKDDFQAEVNNLEMIHDSIEDGSISKWKGDFRKDLHNSISKLKKMVASIMEEYLKIPDLNILERAIKVPPNWLICPKCNDAWEFNTSNAMVVCPKCECAFHNPE